MRLSSKIKTIIAFVSLLGLFGLYLVYDNATQEVDEHFEVAKLKSFINHELKSADGFTASNLQIEDENYEVKYSINRDLQKFIKRRMRYYRPDKIAAVVIDNETGDILSTIGYDRKTKTYDHLLPFTGTHPSASIFKIVTTADLLEHGEVGADSKFKYRGKGTTLYKYQLKDKKSRWNRTTSFEKAFAYSNNVVFGKAAIENTTPFEITEMAESLGFNQQLMDEVSLSKSTFIMPTAGYNLAEIASGFNKKTQMSPVHCAVLSSIIANDGVLISPRLVTSLQDKNHMVAWNNEIVKKKVVNEKTAQEVKQLMARTVKKGTARRPFRYMKRSLKKKLDIGGKTGSITGGFPHGKRDWFTSYAIPKDKSSKGISVCVMNINFEKWYVKSAKVAQEIIQHYYTKILKL